MGTKAIKRERPYTPAVMSCAGRGHDTGGVQGGSRMPEKERYETQRPM